MIKWILHKNIVESIFLKYICVNTILCLFQRSKDSKNASNRMMKSNLFDRSSTTLTSFFNVIFNFGNYFRNFGTNSNFQILFNMFIPSIVKKHFWRNKSFHFNSCFSVSFLYIYYGIDNEVLELITIPCISLNIYNKELTKLYNQISFLWKTKHNIFVLPLNETIYSSYSKENLNVFL